MARSQWTSAVPTLLGLALLAGAGHGEPDAAGTLTFARRSEPVATRNLDALRQATTPATLSVHEPYEGGVVVFEALPFARVLDAVYTPSWRSEEEILFTCSDGYQPVIPVQRVLAHRAWLAFDRVDDEGFTILKRESGSVKRVELGPFYLIWENLDDAQVRQEADYGWPYQLVGVDLVRRQDRFQRMSPPPAAPAEALAGFAAFRVHCSKCHQLNGEGGSIGPELNAAASPVEYRDPAWLRAWIEDPGRIRPGSRMPALNPALPDRAQVVSDILAYLETMRAAGAAPEEH
ncbi:MAG: c-type cytochrome [Deltaproteobacteria bacterium]|nr:c-type cytochrome [Deltaproteobacteria bacterium]